MKFLRNLIFLSLLTGFFATAPSFKGIAQSVTCQGFTFSEGDQIGYDNGAVITRILNNRVYFQRNGVIEDNMSMYYAMRPQDHTNPFLTQDQWWGCVNPRDPSTSGFNFLGPVIYDPTIGQNTIKCGDATIVHNTYLSYWPDNHPNPQPNSARTYFVPKIVDGIIRIAAIRKENPNTLQPSDLLGGPNDNSGSLNGSFEFNYLNPGTGIDLSEDQIKGCIYRSAIKYPDQVTSPCSANPVIGTISPITQTGLTFSFTGAGLPNLKWRIKSGGNTVANGTTGAVNNAGVSLTFGSLPYGDYTLEIEGGDCTSNTNSKAFSITKPNCTAAPVISTFSNVSATGLTINFTGATSANSINWRIKNSSNSVVANGTNTPTGGQSSMSITFNTLADAAYTVEIEANDCSASVSSQTFTLSKPSCATAPTITGITGISGTGLILAFSGGGLPATLAWEIKNSSNSVVRSGITSSLAVGTVSLSFDNLAVGSYSLEIQGGSCTSRVSSSPFSVPRLPCSSGPDIFEKTIYGISATGLTFRFSGAGIHSIAWRILNVDNTPQRASRADLEPQSDRPVISFDALQNNKWYKLEIQGGSTCSSTPSVELFALGNPGALPIYISNFEGVAKKEGVALSWNVVSEKNGEGFQVLRYDDNVKTPQIIASIPLREEKTGAYSYLDENPSNGANYYQLKQIDNDGSFTTSRIINVSFDGVYGMFMAPNPAREFVDVDFESRINGTASFETYSNSGIRVLNSRQKVKVGKNKVRMNVSGLSEGSYILKMENGDVTKSLRFLKVN